MANRLTQLAVGVALAGAIGISIVFAPTKRPHEEVAFLERVASAVERTQALPPQTRHQLSALADRHRSALADERLELRRQRALERIMVAAMPPTDRVAGSVRPRQRAAQ